MSSIMRFPESLAIGVHAMVYLAGNEGRPSTMPDIAEAFSMSVDHLAKVLQQLKRAKLVDSVRGPAGGYVLLKPSDKISLLEVFQALQGDMSPHGCMFKEAMCQSGHRPMGRKIRELEMIFIEYISKFTLQTFAEFLKKPASDATPSLRAMS